MIRYVLAICLHNIFTHPIMPLGELLDWLNFKWSKQLARLIWQCHDNTRGELPRYEKYWNEEANNE